MAKGNAAILKRQKHSSSFLDKVGIHQNQYLSSWIPTAAELDLGHIQNRRFHE